MKTINKKNVCCRHCSNETNFKFVDLGTSPPSNEYLSEDCLDKPEIFYPLQVFVCNKCWLVQTKDFSSGADLFKEDYAYLSSTSLSWLEHCKKYVKQIVNDLDLDSSSFVVELASNDGYLLNYFNESNVPCLGIEPTEGTAKIAQENGVETLVEFFGHKTSEYVKKSYKKADLIIGNNVYAHVPDINDFTKGIKNLLNDSGTVTLEFPSLLSLINEKQFDTIYHEHFSYLSLTSVQNIFKTHGLRVWQVENLLTHGGSLRIYGCHDEATIKTDDSVLDQINKEKRAGLQNIDSYKNFQQVCQTIKITFIEFLLKAKLENKKVIGYGAAAKGSTLLNFSGIKSDLIEYVCDGAEFKQNKFMPGSHIPIKHPSVLEADNPDYIIIFPWNIADEISNLLKDKISDGTKLVTFIPELKIW
tara:strand:- start:4689 stop:5936 length:1248 start_codon:yes stop_codon:yes gene_type:complete